MAWARRSTVHGSGDVANPGATWNIGTLVTPTTNDRLILVICVATPDANGQGTVTGISDGAGNAWTLDLQFQHHFVADAFFQELSVWSCVAKGSSPTNTTLALTNAGGTGVGVAYAYGAYSGISTTTGAAAAVDISVANFASQGASPADSGTTSGTTTGANELKIGIYGDGGYNDVISPGTLDTTYSVFSKDDSNVDAQIVLEDADSGVSGSTARATATWVTGAQDTLMAVVVYKLAAVVVFDWLSHSRPEHFPSHTKLSLVSSGAGPGIGKKI